jgi:hypothetical protein
MVLDWMTSRHRIWEEAEAAAWTVQAVRRTAWEEEEEKRREEKRGSSREEGSYLALLPVSVVPL